MQCFGIAGRAAAAGFESCWGGSPGKMAHLAHALPPTVAYPPHVFVLIGSS